MGYFAAMKAMELFTGRDKAFDDPDGRTARQELRRPSRGHRRSDDWRGGGPEYDDEYEYEYEYDDILDERGASTRAYG
eukprot:6417579-Prymnesium_polylepis.1